MKHRTAWCVLAILLSLSFAAAAYAQGMYWETVTSGGPMGDKGRLAMMYYIPQKFKTVTEDGQTTILLIDKKMIYSVDPKEKTYSEMTFDELEGMMKKTGEQMDERMAELQKEMEGMPEEQRKMVEAMMKGKMHGHNAGAADAADAKIEVKKSGEKKTVSGHSCMKVSVMQDDKEFLTAWVTRDVKDFDGMRNDLKEFRERMAAMNPMMPKGLSEAMGKMEGFPMEIELDQGVKQVVTKIEKKTIAASEFEIPEGYKKVEPKFMDEGKADKKK
jgi:hypothetical protein